MTTFEGLNIDDGNKKGFVTDTATMTFNCKCEFWGTGLYYYFTQKVINDIADDLKPKDPSGTIIPLFTIDIISYIILLFLKLMRKWMVRNLMLLIFLQ